MNTVTKADLVRIVSAGFGYSKIEARQFVDTFFEALTDAIIQGDRIEARGFGAFTVKGANAKAGARNPKTGEKVYVPARRKVAFKPGRILREALSQPTTEPARPAPRAEAAHPQHTNGSSHRPPALPPSQVPAQGTHLSR